jgi:uncharacterized membrane protein YphA (DoxX/SURF4 family)
LTLIHPDGTEVRLKDADINEDGANWTASYPDSATPAGNLGALAGKSMAGTWRLRVRDAFAQDAGTLNAWSLSLGLPSVLAYLTILAEVGGGILLILGIYARVVAVLLIPVLAGAWYFAHADKGWLFSNAGGGWEYIAFLIAACAAVALTGPGAMALVNERR